MSKTQTIPNCACAAVNVEAAVSSNNRKDKRSETEGYSYQSAVRRAKTYHPPDDRYACGVQHPLIIDQPEDDLDNAFISSAVVKTLRSIKERRQVILVTHNANIAVLGDAELLLPMRRQGDGGTAFDRGSIDKTDTNKQSLIFWKVVV